MGIEKARLVGLSSDGCRIWDDGYHQDKRLGHTCLVRSDLLCFECQIHSSEPKRANPTILRIATTIADQVLGTELTTAEPRRGIVFREKAGLFRVIAFRERAH